MGLVNLVGNYLLMMFWDMVFYVVGVVVVYEFCLIEKLEFDWCMMWFFMMIKGFELFCGEMFNKVYYIKLGMKVDYINKVGEIGFFVFDIG